MPATTKDSVFVITKTGKARVSKSLKGACPTQAQLSHFLTTQREAITSLTITPDFLHEQGVLDFAATGCLPNLQSLTLTAVTINSLVFTSANTPALKTLKLCELDIPRSDTTVFSLELPYLETLEIYHVRVLGPSDFGLSLSRCPNLKVFLSRKLWFLEGRNFAVLPKCVLFRLIRSEGTKSLEILSAPKLEQLAVNCCYEMTNLKLWDLPYDICPSDVERLNSEIEKAEKRVYTELRKSVDSWRDGSGGRKAFEKGWIEEHDIPGFNFAKSEQVQRRLDMELNDEFEKQYEQAKKDVWETFVAHLSQRQPQVTDHNLLPLCEVDYGNTFADKDSRKHLKANQRVIIQTDEND